MSVSAVAPSRWGLGQAIDDACGVAQLQTLEREGWAGTIAQQALQPGAIVRAHARLLGEGGLWPAWRTQGEDGADGARLHQLLILMARPRVALRPRRIERRLVKRRRNRFGLMMQPREQARAQVRDHGSLKKQM